MTVKRIDAAALGAWVNDLVKKQRVYGVQARGDRFAFAELNKAADLRLDHDVTILPPKKYFLPQREAILKFDREAGFESVLDDEPFVLLGVHPYDMAAISQMDKVFESDNIDIHYVMRRNNATIVVCDVQNASNDVFAGCMGTATVEDGFDALLTKIDENYILEAKTEKGEELVRCLADAADADQAELNLREQVRARNKQLLRKHELAVLPSVLPKILGRSHDHPVWENKAERCFSCGSCNMVCPTCYCFDVSDDPDWSLKKGERCRSWDACLLSDFAAVAGGHNFRRDRAARYRHRFYRKGKYLQEKIGEVACVGCGRCVAACTAGIANPVEVYNQLVEET